MEKMTKEEVLNFFAKHSGLSVARLVKAPIGSSTLSRPFLIDLIEALEKKTGKNILADSDAPMRYLPENTTIEDIAEAFSTNGTKIRRIYKLLFQAPTKGLEERCKLYRSESLTEYEILIGRDLTEDELIVNIFNKDLSFYNTPWELTLQFLEETLKIKLPDNLLNWNAESNKKVSDVLNLCVEQMLKRK